MDSRIALSVQPLQLPDQSASLQKALTLNALLGQSDLQGLQTEEARRTLRQNNAIDQALQSSSSADDVYKALLRISPKQAAEFQKANLEGRETQGKINKSNIEQQGSLAAGFASLPTPEARAAAYSSLVAQHNQLLSPGQKPLENEPWNEAYLPNLQKFVVSALAPKDALERSDTRAAAVQPAPIAASPTIAALQGDQPIVKPMAQSNIQGQPMPPAGPLAGQPAGPGAVAPMAMAMAAAPAPAAEPVLPQTNVDAVGANPRIAEYRAEADRQRRLGTTIGNQNAKTYMDEAKALEENDVKMRERFSSAPDAPGVVYNKATGEFSMNGKPISAEAIQKIATANRQAGATNVIQNAGPKAFLGKFGDNLADQLSSEQKGAQRASDTIQATNQMRQAMDAGTFSNGGADAKTNAVNILKGIGVPVPDDWNTKLANSQAFSSFVGTQLLNHAKDLGSNPSNADASRIEKIVGTIGTDPQAIQKIMDFNEEMGRKAIDRYNSHYNQVKQDPNANFGFDASVKQPDKYQKAQKAPAGLDGWHMETDANGNKAWVSPDRKQFREIQGGQQ